eukprot:COSAG01_NODE_2858_length_6960_cov_31.694797_2_plen_119_part_00
MRILITAIYSSLVKPCRQMGGRLEARPCSPSATAASREMASATPPARARRYANLRACHGYCGFSSPASRSAWPVALCMYTMAGCLLSIGVARGIMYTMAGCLRWGAYAGHAGQCVAWA